MRLSIERNFRIFANPLAATSLPPGVKGQRRGTLEVRVDNLVWHASNPPKASSVKLSWWGDAANEATVGFISPRRNLQLLTIRDGILTIRDGILCACGHPQMKLIRKRTLYLRLLFFLLMKIRPITFSLDVDIHCSVPCIHCYQMLFP